MTEKKNYCVIIKIYIYMLAHINIFIYIYIFFFFKKHKPMTGKKKWSDE